MCACQYTADTMDSYAIQLAYIYIHMCVFKCITSTLLYVIMFEHCMHTKENFFWFFSIMTNFVWILYYAQDLANYPGYQNNLSLIVVNTLYISFLFISTGIFSIQ